jgi:predicted NUDIX family phosphoesterase
MSQSPNKDLELVLCVEQDSLFDFLDTDGGFKCYVGLELDELLDFIKDNKLFLYRYMAENKPQYKQIIPYCTLKCGDDYYLLTRKDTQYETRLHGKSHLGVGGHINPLDRKIYSKTDSEFMMSCMRELNEELNISINITKEDFSMLCCIFDKKNAVGKVHFGVALLLNIPEDKKELISVKETDKMDGKWVSKTDLKDMYESMESWTQIIVKNFIF